MGIHQRAKTDKIPVLMELTIQWVKTKKQKLHGVLEGGKWDTEKELGRGIECRE